MSVRSSRDRRRRARGPYGGADAGTRGRAGRIVFEAGARVGGIARTEDISRLSLRHRRPPLLHEDPRGPAALGRWLGDDSVRVRRLSRIFYQGRFYDYPLSLPNVVCNLGVIESARIASSYAWARLAPIRAGGKLRGLGHEPIRRSALPDVLQERTRRRSGACPATSFAPTGPRSASAASRSRAPSRTHSGSAERHLLDRRVPLPAARAGPDVGAPQQLVERPAGSVELSAASSGSITTARRSGSSSSGGTGDSRRMP